MRRSTLGDGIVARAPEPEHEHDRAELEVDIGRRGAVPAESPDDRVDLGREAALRLGDPRVMRVGDDDP
jgi:hypothetical protein